MTPQSFEQFRAQVNADKSLQAEVAACFSSPPTDGSTGVDKLVALGKSHGFEFTAQEAQGATATDGATLSDFELEMISAGTSFSAFVMYDQEPSRQTSSKNSKNFWA